MIKYLTVGVDYRTSPCEERVQPVELSRRVGADFVQADSATIAGLQSLLSNVRHYSRSYAPVSQAAPLGRGSPRWSVGSQVKGPASIAGLPDCKA